MKRYLSVVLFSCLIFFGGLPIGLLAQEVTPALMVKEGDTSRPLGLIKLRAEAKIYGFVARTSMTMTFFNPTDRVMEGTLYFPLPEGSTVSGYALDIEGKMIDGVAVEKTKGRVVFEKIVRQGIDPGLIEWTKGNNFKTRVYPIPAKGTRTIRVDYVSELIGGDAAPAYRLPLHMKEKLEEFSVRLEVVKPDEVPTVEAVGLANFSFEKWEENYVAEATRTDYQPDHDLVVAIPDAKAGHALVEKSNDGTYRFAVEDFPKPTADGDGGKRALSPDRAPKRFTILWDASGSRDQASTAREVQLLASLFGQWSAGSGGTVDVRLVLIRDRLCGEQNFKLSPSDPSALIEALKAIQYDGGTQIGAIQPLDGPAPDFYLLFSDGISTFGSSEPQSLDAPLYTFSSAAGADHAMLRRLATEGRGEYFNLARMTDPQVIESLGREPYRYLGTRVVSGEVDEIYPAGPQSAADRIVVVGRLKSPTAQIAIEYGRGDRVEQSKTVDLSQADAPTGTLLERLWAQKKLAELLIDQEGNEEAIVELGRRFQMVTPFTSLIVLDNIDQYVEHEIEPPASLPEMRDEYNRRIDTIEHQKQQQKESKIEQVLAMWKERVAWWEKEYKYPKDFRYQEEAKKEGATLGPEAVEADTLEEAVEEVIEGENMIRSYGGAAARVGHDNQGGQAEGTDGKAVDTPVQNVPAQATTPAADPGSATIVDERPESHLINPRPESDEGLTLDDVLGLEPPSEGGSPEMPEFSTQISGGRESDENRFSIAPATAEGNTALPPTPTRALHDRRTAQAGDDGRPGEGRDAGISIQEWNPDTPYLKELEKAAPDDRFDVYMKQRAENTTSPAFFLDCADFFQRAGSPTLAVQVLSNLAELELDNPQILRVLGYRLAQWGHLDLAVITLEEVKTMRPEEPQSCRDLGLVLACRAGCLMPASEDSEAARKQLDDYRRAVNLLTETVMGNWDGRFNGIEVLALEEINRILPDAKKAGLSEKEITLDKRLIKLLDVDIRIVMSWDADLTDIDLWVTEPSNEKAYYSHNRTTIGGLVSNDFTGGYGPEEYMVRKAMPGKYKIQAHFYGSSAVKVLGSVTVQVDVFTNFGRENQQRKSLTLQLKKADDVYTIGEIEF